MDIAYGIDVKPRGDPYIATAEHAVESISATTNAGSYLVDVLPIRELLNSMPVVSATNTPEVKYTPEWFPGAQFQKEAKEWKVSVMKMLHQPYNVVKARMVRYSTSAGKIMSLIGCRPRERRGIVRLQRSSNRGSIRMPETKNTWKR